MMRRQSKALAILTLLGAIALPAASAQTNATMPFSIQNNTGHQTAVRGLAKCQFMVGVAIAVSRSVKTDVFLHVQEQLGEILGYLQLIEGALRLSELKAETTESGAMRPAAKSRTPTSV